MEQRRYAVPTNGVNVTRYTIRRIFKKNGIIMRKARLWPINPEAVTKRSMVKPEMNSTILGKRGRKMEREDVMIDGSTTDVLTRRMSLLRTRNLEEIKPLKRKKLV